MPRNFGGRTEALAFPRGNGLVARILDISKAVLKKLYERITF
jgi:hypothetical protein